MLNANNYDHRPDGTSNIYHVTRNPQADSTSHLDLLDHRNTKGREPYMTSSHEMDISSSSNRQPAVSRELDHRNHAAVRVPERSRSPQYVSSLHTSEKSRSSPERRHDSDRNYDWIHTREELPVGNNAPEPVRSNFHLILSNLSLTIYFMKVFRFFFRYSHKPVHGECVHVAGVGMCYCREVGMLLAV